MASRLPTGERELRSVGWIRDLGRPYLKDFSPSLERAASLRGCRFSLPAASDSKGRNKGRFGFFAGFLLAPDSCADLNPQPPECLVFAFVEPIGSPLHRRLVLAPDSLFRKTHAFISFLTHRPPRFQLSETGPATLVRHVPLATFPDGRRAHYARNFYIETLAWLVRSALVRRLASESIVK